MFEAVFFCANHFEVYRTGIAIFVKDANVSHKVNVATAIGLVFRGTWAVLFAFAVANVNVFDTRDDGGNGVYGVFVCAVNV